MFPAEQGRTRMTPFSTEQSSIEVFRVVVANLFGILTLFSFFFKLFFCTVNLCQCLMVLVSRFQFSSCVSKGVCARNFKKPFSTTWSGGGKPVTE